MDQNLNSSKDSDNLVTKAYRTAIELCNSGFKCWLSEIFSLLQKYNIDVDLANEDNFISYFKEMIFNKYKAEWFSMT